MAFRRGVALLRQGLARRMLAAHPADHSLEAAKLVAVDAPPTMTFCVPTFLDEPVASTSVNWNGTHWKLRGKHEYSAKPWWGQARCISSGSGGDGKSGQPSEGERGGIHSEQQGGQGGGEDESSAVALSGTAGDCEGGEEEEGEEVLEDEKDYWPYPFPDELEVDEDELASYLVGEDVRGIPGLPPYEDIIGADDDQEEKEKRREKERKHQEEIAATRVQKIDDFGRAYATGRRKTSTARVWLMEGEGRISVNGKPYDKVFPNILQRVEILSPLCEVDRLGAFDVRSTVKGGGIQGQAQAIRHGISRALQLFDPALRSTLKSAGLLTRDPRMVERKKPGRKKARKSFQWVKR